MKKFISNHSSKATAFEIENYPYGRLRTSMFVWIETVAKKGDRVCRQTINPKNGRLNAVKCSTYSNLMFLFIDEIGHVKTQEANIYTKREEVKELVNEYGKENLNEEQQKQYRQLTGEILVTQNEFTGEYEKNYSIKWDKDKDGKNRELKITFDRPDGVQIIEIFKAMKSVNQTRLNEVFEIRESKMFGDHAGTVRICTRGGMQLATVDEEEYKSFLASDLNQELEEQTQNF
jgi:hypothetical protein